MPTLRRSISIYSSLSSVVHINQNRRWAKKDTLIKTAAGQKKLGDSYKKLRCAAAEFLEILA